MRTHAGCWRSLHRPATRAVALLLLVGAASCDAGTDTGDRPGAVTEMPAPTGPGSAEPNLAVDDEGRVLLSWQEPVAGAHELRFATLHNEGWSPATTIARGTDWFVNWADFPAILRLPDGRLAAHYLQRDPDAQRGYHYGIRVVQSDDEGRTWSDPVTPHRDGVSAEHGFVSLFPAAGDSLGVIWLDGRSFAPEFGAREEMALLYTTVAPDGTLGPELTVDERICECCQTSVARTGEGVVVAYRGRSVGEIRDIRVARRTGAGWHPGRTVHDDGWHIAACPVNGPAVASDGGDHVVVAWFTGARDTARVQVAFSADGGQNFGPPVRVDEGDPTGRVDVAMLRGGGALVVWIERGPGDAASVLARRVGADGHLAPALVVAASSSARASGFPRLVRTGDQAVIAWTDITAGGGSSRVRTARIDPGPAGSAPGVR